LFLPKSAKKVEKTLDFFRKSCRIDTVVIDMEVEMSGLFVAVFLSTIVYKVFLDASVKNIVNLGK